MAKQSKITAKLDKLEEVLRAIGGELEVRVGILGSNASAVHDEESDLTNSEVGLIQEFGSEKNGIPPRSFLRMPIEQKQEAIVGVMSSKLVKGLVKSGNIKGVYDVLGEVAAGVVKEAFPTSGYGNWKPNARSTIRKKGSSRPLIDTGTLAGSITYDVVRKGEF
jgi:hypothetical protein